jgi:hypothetical protein
MEHNLGIVGELDAAAASCVAPFFAASIWSENRQRCADLWNGEDMASQ